jgi:hypothetical protein
MYTKGNNGERMEVSFKANDEIKAPAPTTAEKPEGSNKMLLYCALALGLVILGVSGYMIYKDHKKNKSKANVGYEVV